MPCELIFFTKEKGVSSTHREKKKGDFSCESESLLQRKTEREEMQQGGELGLRELSWGLRNQEDNFLNFRRGSNC